MSHYSRLFIKRMNQAGSEAGTSLIEMMIAAGLTLVLAYTAMNLWQSYDQAARAHQTNEGLGEEVTELTSTLQRFWNTRSHPAGYSGSFTAASSGFSLLDSNSQPCTQACPQLVISQAEGAASVTVLTQCVSPGTVPGLSRLRTLPFYSQMRTACIQCGDGQVPVVTITSSAKAQDNRRFPHNVSAAGATSAGNSPDAAPAKFSINGILGFSLCFDQAGTGPLAIDLRGYLLDPHAAKDALLVSQQNSLMSFDNFANIRVEAGP